MMTPLARTFVLASAVLLTACAAPGPKPSPKMTFFVTSVNPGQGGNLGGLRGADRHCQALAEAVGAGAQLWRAYLSVTEPGAIHARDRIGRGPWFNYKGVQIAASVDELHSDRNNLNKETALTEKGEPVPGRGDAVNMHDILTGSTPDGRAVADARTGTCNNWRSGDEGSAVVGHHDRLGLGDDEASRSWNASHRTRGCSMEAFKETGGAGLFYCFALN